MILTSMSVVSPAVRAMADAELMAAMKDGNHEALDTLFHRYARLVYRVASHILKDRGEAEDSTQDIFLEIYRKAHLYDPERGPVRGWLLQYTYRRTLRRRTVLGRRVGYHAEPIESVASPPHRPPRLSTDECRWLLRSGLARLPEKQRTTLELTCFEDLTLRDIAGRLGVSVGCTRHYYYKGLARLQQWARITAAAHVPRCHAASPAGRVDVARGRGPRRRDRGGTQAASARR